MSTLGLWPPSFFLQTLQWKSKEETKKEERGTEVWSSESSERQPLRTLCLFSPPFPYPSFSLLKSWKRWLSLPTCQTKPVADPLWAFLATLTSSLPSPQPRGLFWSGNGNPPCNSQRRVYGFESLNVYNRMQVPPLALSLFGGSTDF